jgi:hypothetical protein
LAVRLDRFQAAGARGCPHKETTMPDTSSFTLGLFDKTALSSWSNHLLQATLDSCEPDRADTDDADTDGDMPAPATDPVARGSNFYLAADRELARPGPRQRRRDRPVQGA